MQQYYKVVNRICSANGVPLAAYGGWRAFEQIVPREFRQDVVEKMESPMEHDIPPSAVKDFKCGGAAIPPQYQLPDSVVAEEED